QHSSAGESSGPLLPAGQEEWPEVEKAEKLARGAALKWASGVFYRPENLEGLGHYRSRETQRNSSIQSRLKSTVQSYLEGVSAGLEQLRAAVQEVQSVCQELGAARWALLDCADRFQDLQQMRALMAEHVQLASVVQVLPQLFSVHEVFSHTLQLLRGQHLLEAHAEIMMLEHLRDDILSQLHLRGLSSAQATVLAYFGGLQELNESLAKQLWGIVASSLQLVREDPVLFVTAVRIIEREEKIDDTLLLDATFLPPGRPKGWRQKFYHVLQETITGSRFHTPRVDAEGPGLSRHLEALQRDIVSELRVVKDLMVQCVPAHYNILSLCAATYHQALTGHLQDLLREDLDKQALFHLLKWVLHVYHSSEMMGHPDLLPEVDVSSLGPLISPELVDQAERRYVVKLKASVLEWMQRTLKTEFEEWFWEKEPETDHQGFFQSDLPVHVIEVGNIEVTSSITDSLQQKVYNMALEELEAFLGRSVEPLTPLPLLADPASPQPSSTGWWQICHVAPPVPIQASFFHGVQDGSHDPTHYPTSQWQDWKEPRRVVGSACTPRSRRSTPAPGVCGKAPAHRGSLVVLQSAGSPRATGEGAPAGSHHTQALRPLPPGHAQQRPGPQVTGTSLSTSRSNRSTCREPQVLHPRCTSQATRPLPSLSLLAPLSPLCTPTPPAEKSPRPSGLL
uniref:Exocyst complex component 3 like 1 n=1 Tax=Anas platyrhynchos platyrhynchos TaxID=8840 RepID=A0A493TZA0_ANAPP